mgnify:CR=1 FL=1
MQILQQDHRFTVAYLAAFHHFQRLSEGHFKHFNIFILDPAAAGRETGAIAPGLWADLVAVDLHNPVMAGRAGDQLLDSLIFAGHDGLIRDVWSAGRHMVHEGKHMDHDRIMSEYLQTIARIQDRM